MLRVKASGKNAADRFRFRRHDNVGVADAENDYDFLKDCFIQTGDLDVLKNCGDPRRVLLGRTGAGKTALLTYFGETTSNVIQVKPESLALNYISNSNILQFVLQLGVSLDVFFRLLWRHVFVVEIIKAHFKLRNKDDQLSFWQTIRQVLSGNQKHEQALEYLRKWGESFWEDTDYRIKEVTTKLESDLKASVGINVPPAMFNAEGAQRLSEEQKHDVVQRAQHVVNDVQIKELSQIIDVLNDILVDPQKRYYITIDRLDENWIEDKLRYLLIRALIETSRDFRKVRQAKIIIALRYDLVDRVFRQTRDAGFQEEKYEALFLHLNWNKHQLAQVLDARVNHLVRQRYTSQPVTYKDLLPKTMEKEKTPGIDYMLERTLMRPRDIILFFNYCIAKAENDPRITATMLKQAEADYSRLRLRSVEQEWLSDYPNLFLAVEILQNRKSDFRVSDLSGEDVDNLCLKLAIEGGERRDELFEMAERVVDCVLLAKQFRCKLLSILYTVGLIGLKLEKHEGVLWCYESRREVTPSEIEENDSISVHPCFWRALGVKPTFWRGAKAGKKE